MATKIAEGQAAAMQPGRKRLLIAVTLSLLVHLALLLGISVQPARGVSRFASTMHARIELAPSAAPEVISEPQLAAAAESNPSDLVDPHPEPALAIAEPKLATDLARSPPSTPQTSGIELPQILDPTYYSAKQLDVYPQPLAPIVLNYPSIAFAEKLDGSLLLLMLIDEFGFLADASIIEADPAGYFEQATLSGFSSARFSPGIKEGRAVKSRVMVRVRYIHGESPIYGESERANR